MKFGNIGTSGFVAIVEQIEKRMKKNDQHLVPVSIYLHFPAIFVITLKPVCAAFRKFVRVFRSYSRAN
jgi:hypothetical protein